MASNQQPRTYAAAHFALELDGKKDVGLFRSIEGGGVKADVMTYQNGASYDKWRSIGKPKFEDIKVQVGMSMSKPFYEWIEKFFDGIADRKNGAIVAADFYYNERARREFTNAMIKELTFPKLDGQDTKAAYMSVAQNCHAMPKDRKADHTARQVKHPATTERTRAATSPGPTTANTPRCAKL